MCDPEQRTGGVTPYRHGNERVLEPEGWFPVSREVCAMNILVLLIILLLVFGGGGFYMGGPLIGGSLGGIILLVLVVMLLTGRLGT